MSNIIRSLEYIGQNLTKVDFRYHEFHDCIFDDAILASADLLGSVFFNCSFIGANFYQAYINGVQFIDCNMSMASFDESYIFSSRFTGCDLSCVRFNTDLFVNTEFENSVFNGTVWKDHEIKSAPLFINGIEYPLTILDNGYMQVGCEYNTIEWFYTTDDKYSAKMEGLKARRFWKRNKAWIFKMLKDRGIYDHTTV